MVDHIELWNKILNELETKYDSAIFDDLFKPCKPYKIKNGFLLIITPSLYVQTRINKLYSKTINEIILKYIKDTLIQVKFILNSDVDEEKEKIEKKIKPYRNNLNPNYIFNNYVVGQSNRFAYQIALRVADQPGQFVNPLYIFGSVGLGKTHLMEAIGNYILDNDVNKRVLYVKASEFVEDYIKMCRDNAKNSSFDEKYRNLDILLIDDIQSLELAVKSQNEFFKIFDILFNSNKQIVITSDRPAKELHIVDRLISRFEEGCTADIQLPNLEHRIDIIKRKLEEAGYENVDNDVLKYIAEVFINNIRELEGAVNRLVYYCQFSNLEINLDNAKEALSALITKSNSIPKNTVNFYNNVIETIAAYYNLTYDQIISKNRAAQIVLSRQIAMYILKNNYGLAYKKIGQLFGGKDHSTVMSAVEKVEQLMTEDENLKIAVDTICKKLNV